MWKIIQIFDGDYGCEELVPGAKPKVSVTLENERGEQKYISVEDEWLVENHLDIGSEWSEEKMKYKGWTAHMIQHELDHVAGIVI